MARVDSEVKLLKCMEKKEALEFKKTKIEEELKKINETMKELQVEIEEKELRETLLVLKGQGIRIQDIKKAVESGNLDFLKQHRVVEEVVSE